MRYFTPDGRMVGDIGEVLAANFFGVNLHAVGRHDWDGTHNGRNVQIKATGGVDTYLKAPAKGGYGDGLMLVFKIDRENGKYKVVYNGDIKRVWRALKHKKLDKSGAKMISIKRLLELQKQVSPKYIIPEVG